MIPDICEHCHIRHQLSLALEGPLAGTWEWAPAPNRLTLSAGARAAFDYPEATDPLSLESFMELLRPQDRDPVVRAFQETYHAGASLSVQFRAGSEQQRWYHCVGKCVVDGDPERTRLTGILIDIDDKRALQEQENELAELRERVTHAARLGTLGEMAAGLAHEINQPLSAISTYSEASLRLLSQQNPDLDRVRHAMKQVSEQAHRAGKVIRRMRALSKRTATRRELANCNRLIEDLVGLIQIDARGHDIQVSFELDSSAPDCYLDQVQIQQVILNFVRNALDAMSDSDDRGKGIRVRTALEKNGAVKVSVFDHGPGIDEGTAAHLFDPFFTTKEGGMGLGLSVCQSIVKQHGGSIGFEENPDGGAVFWFALPVNEDALDDE